MQEIITKLSSLWSRADRPEDEDSARDNCTKKTQSHQQPSSSTKTVNYLPIYGQNSLDLIPNIIDRHATCNPEKVFASIPFDNSDLSQGFRDISYLEFRIAVDKAAYWLEETLGTSPRGGHDKSDFPVFAFYGARDLRYSIFVVAAMKAGFKMLSPSLLCAIDAHVHLVKESHCHSLLCIPATLPLAKKIIEEATLTTPAALSTKIVPELSDFLPLQKTPSSNPEKLYCFNKSWDEACDFPCLVIHTSGSTGMPKIVCYTMRMLAVPLINRLLPPLNSQPPLVDGLRGRVFTTVPPFHLLGYAGFLVCPIYFDAVCVMAPPDRVMDASLAHEIHQHARLDTGMYHPSLLQDLVRDEVKRKELGKLKAIFYSGSPLETTTGNWLAANFGNLGNILGSTESFAWPNARVVDPVKDWSYVYFYPVDGLEFRPIGLAATSAEPGMNGDDENSNDELYELIVHRTPHTEALTNIFRARPQETIWHTNDLWKPHPDPAKESHWLYQGRTDDLVVLSGEIKMYAAFLEDKISSAHPLIRAALVGGNQRKSPFLLLELVQTATSSDGEGATATTAATLDEIWPSLDAINTRWTHASVRLNRSLVLIADKKTGPFVRLAKGSVARNQTFELYKEEIEGLYAEMEKEEC